LGSRSRLRSRGQAGLPFGPSSAPYASGAPRYCFRSGDAGLAHPAATTQDASQSPRPPLKLALVGCSNCCSGLAAVKCCSRWARPLGSWIVLLVVSVIALRYCPWPSDCSVAILDGPRPLAGERAGKWSKLGPLTRDWSPSGLSRQWVRCSNGPGRRTCCWMS
jgi:hypothetical protein